LLLQWNCRLSDFTALPEWWQWAALPTAGRVESFNMDPIFCYSRYIRQWWQ